VKSVKIDLHFERWVMHGKGSSIDTLFYETSRIRE